MWHGYYLIKMDNVLTSKQWDDINIDLLDMGRTIVTHPADMPCYITHSRKSLNGKEVIVEITIDKEIKKDDIVTKLMNTLSATKVDVENKILNWIIFAGSTWLKRSENANIYIKNNDSNWNPE